MSWSLVMLRNHKAKAAARYKYDEDRPFRIALMITGWSTLATLTGVALARLVSL